MHLGHPYRTNIGWVIPRSRKGFALVLALVSSTVAFVVFDAREAQAQQKPTVVRQHVATTAGGGDGVPDVAVLLLEPVAGAPFVEGPAVPPPVVSVPNPRPEPEHALELVTYPAPEPVPEPSTGSTLPEAPVSLPEEGGLALPKEPVPPPVVRSPDPAGFGGTPSPPPVSEPAPRSSEPSPRPVLGPATLEKRESLPPPTQGAPAQEAPRPAEVPPVEHAEPPQAEPRLAPLPENTPPGAPTIATPIALPAAAPTEAPLVPSPAEGHGPSTALEPSAPAVSAPVYEQGSPSLLPPSLAGTTTSAASSTVEAFRATAAASAVSLVSDAAEVLTALAGLPLAGGPIVEPSPTGEAQEEPSEGTPQQQQPAPPIAPAASGYFSASTGVGGQVGPGGGFAPLLVGILALLATILLGPYFRTYLVSCELPKPSSALLGPLERPG